MRIDQVRKRQSMVRQTSVHVVYTQCYLPHITASSPLPLSTSTLTSMRHPVSLAPQPPSPSDTPARPAPAHSQSNADISCVPTVVRDGKQHSDYQQGEEAPQDSHSHDKRHCVQGLVTLQKAKYSRFCSIAHEGHAEKFRLDCAAPW